MQLAQTVDFATLMLTLGVIAPTVVTLLVWAGYQVLDHLNKRRERQ